MCGNIKIQIIINNKKEENSAFHCVGAGDVVEWCVVIIKKKKRECSWHCQGAGGVVEWCLVECWIMCGKMMCGTIMCGTIIVQ